MELFVSSSKWGSRKAPEGVAGVYRIEFDTGAIVRRAEFPIPAGATRGFGGLTCDDRYVYAARMVGPTQDAIARFDRETLELVDESAFEVFHDVHQIDLFGGFLWICNTNHHELVIADVATMKPVLRRKIFPDVPEERSLTTSVRRPQGDHRQRPHINSIQVRQGEVQLGLFGVGGGDFMSPQLLRIPWRQAGGTIELGDVYPVFVTGFRFPHNVQFRPDGSVLGCSSGEGELVIGSRKVVTKGWPRGVAMDAENLYVGVSSYSYGFTCNDGVAETPAGVARVRRDTGEITGWFSFQREGQVYDVRLALGVDYGLSAHAAADPLVSPDHRPGPGVRGAPSAPLRREGDAWGGPAADLVARGYEQGEDWAVEALQYLRHEREVSQRELHRMSVECQAAEKARAEAEAVLGNLRVQYETVLAELQSFHQLGPVALGVARRLHGLILRYPRATSSLKRVLKKTG